MASLKKFAETYPVVSYVLLCYLITWPIWFCVPLLAGSDWTLGKILTGIGFGPALAVILLDRMRGTGAHIGNRRWWLAFLPVFLIVGSLDISSLLTGDAISAAEFAKTQARGITPVGWVGAIVAAAVAGFIFATVAGSRTPRLASLTTWRLPLRWWLVALFLPASWMLLGLAITLANGDPIEAVNAGLPTTLWLMFVVRSILFTLLVVAVGEEAGWRGWMLPELQKRFSPLLSSAILGVVWGLWHFPLFLNGQYSGEPVLVFAKVGACVILATLFTWLFNRSQGSLLLAVVLHTALNNTPRLVPATDAMGIGLLGAFVLAIVVDRMWRRVKPASC